MFLRGDKVRDIFTGLWFNKPESLCLEGFRACFLITHGSDSPQLAAFYKNAERSEAQANTPQLAAGKFIENMIKQFRKEAGFRQEDMAKELGVSRQTIIAIENDKYNPTLELAMKVAKLLNRHVEDIFFLED